MMQWLLRWLRGQCFALRHHLGFRGLYLLCWFCCLALAFSATSTVLAQDETPAPTPINQSASEANVLATQASAAISRAETAANAASLSATSASSAIDRLLGIIQMVGVLIAIVTAVAGFTFLLRESRERSIEAARTEINKTLAELRSTKDDLEAFREAARSEQETLRIEMQRFFRETAHKVEQLAENVLKDSDRANFALALLPLGERQYRAQDYEGALDTFYRALNMNPNNPVIQLRIGYVLTQAGKFDEARSVLERSLELDPGFSQALAALGYVYRRIGERMAEGIERDRMLLEAESKLLQALQASPKLVDDDGESWWGSLGGLYRRREQIEQAIAAYQRAAEVTPFSSYPVSNLALLYIQKGDVQKMLDTYKRLERLAKGEIQAEIDNYWAYSDLLTAQLSQWKLNEAEVSLEFFLDVVPISSPFALHALTDTLTRLATALGVTDNGKHILPFIDKIKQEIARREATEVEDKSEMTIAAQDAEAAPSDAS
ncbi:MAG: tetratricopeptide repeat protein [Chloroflexota bacterium]|nr:tetratricopeptide repeat protein [Chloroflexota bacterium]